MKRLFYRRVSVWFVPPIWMVRCYYDAKRDECVYAAFPLHFLVILAWRLNCAWARYRNHPSWIDRELGFSAFAPRVRTRPGEPV